MRMEKRSVLSPLAKSLITVVLSLGAGFVAGSSSLLATLRSETNDSSDTPAANLAQGVEISHCQGRVNWAEVRAAGFSFAWVKATEGDSLMDASFVRNWDAARNALLSTGAYHTFESGTDPVRQAVHFVENVGVPYDGKLPPLLQIAPGGSLPADSLGSMANQWIRVVKDSLKISKIAYTGNAATIDSLGSLFARDSTVVAVYDGGCAGNSSSWWYRRCTDRDSVAGIAGPASTVVFNGSDSIFARFIESHGIGTN